MILCTKRKPENTVRENCKIILGFELEGKEGEYIFRQERGVRRPKAGKRKYAQSGNQKILSEKTAQ